MSYSDNPGGRELLGQRIHRLVFDIETAPHPRASEWLPVHKAPGTYKDPIKIAEYVARKQAETLDKAALDPDLGRIVAIGWFDESTATTAAAIAKTERQERNLLLKFWGQCFDRQLVGYNCLSFDLPYLLRRSDYLGVPVGRTFDLSPYSRRNDVVDLMLRLSLNGVLTRRSLAFHAARRGLVAADAISGKDVPACVANGDWSLVKKHVRADVKVTVKLARSMGVMPITNKRRIRGAFPSTDQDD